MHSVTGEKVGSTKGRFGELGWEKRLIAELFTVDGIAGEIRKTTNGIKEHRRSSIGEEKPKAGQQFFFIFQTERRQTPEA